MARTCKKPGCTYNVFGGGYCRVHQWLRTDKKPKELKKRTLIKSVKTPDFGFQTQLQVFRHVYFITRKPVRCMLSGQDLTDCMNAPITVWVSYFAHILNKKNHTYWRLNPANIRIISPIAHGIIDNGTLKDREQYPTWNWDLWDQLVEEKKKEYTLFVKENNL